MAISQMWHGRAPILDEIPMELQKLGGEDCVGLLKVIAGGIWS